MSSCSFEMSMPTTTFSIGTHPCACGLALRPERLSGLSGKDASGDTCSPTVSLSLMRDVFRPPATHEAYLHAPDSRYKDASADMRAPGAVNFSTCGSRN